MEQPFADREADSNLRDMNDSAQSTFCGSLRSKKFFLRDTVATEASHYLDASNHCWCRKTQQVFGPDGSSVQPEDCVAGRSCYTSLFDV